MLPLIQVDDVTHVIQLAVAPVFLLTAVGTIISMLTNRLARIVDRIRVLEGPAQLLHADDAQRREVELCLLERRLRLTYLALVCEVFCGLFVGLLIAAAFVDAFIAANLSRLIVGLFLCAMVAFIGGLVVFLREIFLAVMSTGARVR